MRSLRQTRWAIVRQSCLLVVGLLTCTGCQAIHFVDLTGQSEPVTFVDGRESTPTPDGDQTPAERGYRLLLEKPYLPPYFDDEAFNEVWRVWPEELRKRAEKATPAERRAMAFDRYGLTPRPGAESGKPLQYVVKADGGWVMNCFSCHGGAVDGRVIPGLPNSHYALETLTEEIREIKLRKKKRLSTLDTASLFMPLGTTNGTTNAVVFGLLVMAKRNAELEYDGARPTPKMTHHDMDAPPWWHFKKRNQMYIDGFAPKNHRGLMQFVLHRANDGKTVRGWEDDFRDIYAYLESIEPPKYPHTIDRPLAERGRVVFNNNCAQCHGTYGDKPSYPNKIVPIDEIGTDPVRLKAVSAEHRRDYGKSWFAHFGRDKTIEKPDGYVAPPLDGVWASGPYFHNGSVPTLWHVLNPDKRPRVWKRVGKGYDREKVGLMVTTAERIPAGVATKAERRHYFDTRRAGKSAAGHDYPGKLSDEQRRAVLEYLKTL